MKINQSMLDTLNELRRLQPRKAKRLLDVPLSAVGNQMIHFYYQTQNHDARQLILEFMEEAGFSWTKKLIMRDTTSDSGPTHFTGLTEYTRLAAANDPTAHWIQAG